MVEHLKNRHQFGRPIGSFQALKHHVAQLWVEVTRTRAVARYAAGAWPTGDPDSAWAVADPASLCSDVALLAAEECVQLHGGLGFICEHPAHLWLKRAKTDSLRSARRTGTAPRSRRWSSCPARRDVGGRCPVKLADRMSVLGTESAFAVLAKARGLEEQFTRCSTSRWGSRARRHRRTSWRQPSERSSGT